MKTVIVLSLILAVILALHAAIVERDLYNRIWWLDIALHTVGGMWVAAVLIYLLRVRALWPVLLGAVVLGILWEALEYLFNVPFFGLGKRSFSDALWLFDTLVDLIIDAGAAALFWLVTRWGKNKHA